MLRKLHALSLMLMVFAMPLIAQDDATPEATVIAVERAFAKTMADRDLEAFTSFLDPEAIFQGDDGAARGKAAVAARWKAYFEGEIAPFSWEPDTVSVLASGTLAMSSGPVKTPDGRIFARFTSVWRLDESGNWKIIFDKGQAVD